MPAIQLEYGLRGFKLHGDRRLKLRGEERFFSVEQKR
jgi:hypothetical protein